MSVVCAELEQIASNGDDHVRATDLPRLNGGALAAGRVRRSAQQGRLGASPLLRSKLLKCMAPQSDDTVIASDLPRKLKDDDRESICTDELALAHGFLDLEIRGPRTLRHEPLEHVLSANDAAR